MSELEQKLEQRAQQQALAKPARTVLEMLTDPRIQEQLVRSLPKAGITIDRLLRVALTEVRRNPTLAECSQRSVLGSLMIAAQLGLEPGGPLGHFFLVPFKNKGVQEATPILGYKGMITLARRSGEISDIVARPVYEQDHFDFAEGLEDVLVHRPNLKVKDRGKAWCFYGIARYTNGGHLIHVMSLGEVHKFRDRGAAWRYSKSGPWKDDEEQMACKTVIRRMAPYLPLTVEAAGAIAQDVEIEEGRATAAEVLDVRDIEFGDEKRETEQKRRPRTAGSTAEEEPPPEEQPETRQAPVADQAQGEPWSCPICGTTTTVHDQEKHRLAAEEKRRQKESGQLPLEGDE